MFTFQEVTTGVSTRIPDLVRGLEAFATREPWISLPAEDRTNALPAMIDLACALAFSRRRDPELCHRVLETAAEHGALRRRQGVAESTIFEELALVRTAIWADLQTRYGRDCAAATEAILEVDTILGLVAQASLRGYFRNEFERSGSWSSAISSLEEEWLAAADSLPGPGRKEPAASRLMEHHWRRIRRRDGIH